MSDMQQSLIMECVFQSHSFDPKCFKFSFRTAINVSWELTLTLMTLSTITSLDVGDVWTSKVENGLNHDHQLSLYLSIEIARINMQLSESNTKSLRYTVSTVH